MAHPQPTKDREIMLLYRFSSSSWANRVGLPTPEGSVLAVSSQLKQAEAFGYPAGKGGVSFPRSCDESLLVFGGQSHRINVLPTYGFMLELSSPRQVAIQS